MTQVTGIHPPWNRDLSQTAPTAKSHLLIFSQLFPLTSLLNLASFLPAMPQFAILNIFSHQLLFAPPNPVNEFSYSPCAAVVRTMPGYFSFKRSLKAKLSSSLIILSYSVLITASGSRKKIINSPAFNKQFLY